MDDSRRAIFVSIGTLCCLAGVGLLAVTNIPWHWRLALLGVLELAGICAILVALRRSEMEEPAVTPQPTQGDGSGPMVIARELVNNGIIAHTVTQPVPPAVATTDSPVAAPPLTGPALAQTREMIRQQLDTFRNRGATISMAPTRDKVQDRGRPWQEEVIRYLSETFADPQPAALFDQIDTPITGQPPAIALGQRIGEQVAYLGTLKDTLARYELKP